MEGEIKPIWIFENSMSWKDELIANETDARAFLTRALEQRDIPFLLNWNVQTQRSVGSKGISQVSFDIFASNPDDAMDTIVGTQGYILPRDHSLHIELFGVSVTPFGPKYRGEIHRGKELGGIMLKALLGIGTHYAGAVYDIELKKVSNDGYRYWAYMGGFPSSYGVMASPGIGRALSTYLENHSVHDDGTLRDIIAMADQFPYLAYRELAQIRPSKGKRNHDLDQVCDEVLKHCCKNRFGRDMVIDLAEPSTLKIVRERLGVLPCCPISRNRSYFSELAYDRATKENDRRFLDQLARYDAKVFEERARQQALEDAVYG